MRWIYPLLQLDRGIARMTEADENLLRLSFSRVKHIDYKTVSIVAFEQTLLSCYISDRDYDVVYRQALQDAAANP